MRRVGKQAGEGSHPVDVVNAPLVAWGSPVRMSAAVG
jgi:hypothetical protein